MIELGNVWQVLTRQNQCAWAVHAQNGFAPRNGGFQTIRWTPYIQIRDDAQAGNVFDALMRRTVFAQTDGVMGEDVNHTLFHQCGHANRVARVVAEGEESAAVGNVAAVQRHAVHHCGHAKLTYAVGQVVAPNAGLDAHAAFEVG